MISFKEYLEEAYTPQVIKKGDEVVVDPEAVHQITGRFEQMVGKVVAIRNNGMRDRYSIVTENGYRYVFNRADLRL